VLEDFLKDYLLECQEGLALFESQLVMLEREPGSKAILSSIFRVVHSIKGASGFLGLTRMAAVTHEGEELLSKLREGELETNAAIVSGLLTLVDTMRSIATRIESGQGEGIPDDSILINRLKSLQMGVQESPATLKTIEPGIVETVEAALAETSSLATLPSRAQIEPEPPKESTEIVPQPIVEAGVSTSTSVGESTIRVDVTLLDKLMNLVGELVLTRNQLLRCSMVHDEVMFQASSQRLNLITTELQEGMMKTRMQPIRNLSSKLPRVVRDLALACGKSATIVMEGEDTELDKTLSEAIKDPITHIIRNAVDHGIEAADVRVSRGKPPEGTIRLRAYHEGGMVNIEVSDDGNGIDSKKIRRKAVDLGWLTEDVAARWSDRELLGLMFRPGFSTAESLTMVSGRGVGMDVVKSRIESIGGTVDASTRLGEGTTIKMKIPLTLTIINALIVSAGGDRFAIPQVNLVELIRLNGESIRGGLIEIQGTWAIRYRGRLLPVVDLNRVLNVREPVDFRANDSISIVVLQADQIRFGLVVDRIDDAQEIVVRPLARQLKGISCLAGATIMGDGKIALILDVFGLAKGLERAQERVSEFANRTDSSEIHPKSNVQALILVRGTDGSPFAIPLSEVDRLETFADANIEWIADRPVVQYRQSLLPIIDVSACLKGKTWLRDRNEEWNCQVVIHADAGKRVGLVFDRVLDIVDDRLDIVGESSRHGVKFTAAIQGRATELLDIAWIRRKDSLAVASPGEER
jgi:two-component system chemotaxis sensor kinase CheA